MNKEQGFLAITLMSIIVILLSIYPCWAQNANSIKTIVKKTDFMGDTLNVYTMHGEFYLNSLGRNGIENKNYSSHEKIIIDSEKRGKQILIRYRYDQGHGREIVDVIPMK